MNDSMNDCVRFTDWLHLWLIHWLIAELNDIKLFNLKAAINLKSYKLLIKIDIFISATLDFSSLVELCSFISNPLAALPASSQLSWGLLFVFLSKATITTTLWLPGIDAASILVWAGPSFCKLIMALSLRQLPGNWQDEKNKSLT